MAAIKLVDGLGKTLAKVGEDEALVDNQHDKTINNKPHKLVTSAKKAETGYVATEEIAQRDVTSVQIPASFAGLESVCIPVRMKNQLFEIEEVNEQDDYVEITAKHIFYQQRKNYTLWNPVLGMNYTGAAACRNIMANAIMDMGFEVASDCGDEVRNGDVMDYARKNIVEAFLDPETGVCAMYNLSMVRDNDVFYCLKEVGYDRGIVIQDKKNMLGVQRIENIEETVTRVVPYGKDEDGEIVWMNHDGKKWLDSTHINDYSKPKVGLLDTRLQIGSDGVTADNIQAKLLEKAQKAYSDDHIDAPDVSMTIQFISLGDTEEYAQYRGLDKVYLYDVLHVKDLERGYSYSAEVVGVEHDILTGRLNSVTIGKLVDWDGIRKVMTWQIPEINGDSIRLHTIKEGSFRAGAVRSNDIANNAVTANHFSNSAETKVKNLCVEQLIVENTSPDGLLNTRFQVTEGLIQSEITDRTNADAQMSSRITQTANAITAEVTRATAAEGTLSGRITVEAGKISQIVSAVGADGQVTAASIVLAINQSTGESEAKIDAQHVYIGNEKSTTVINGKLNASDITAEFLNSKIAQIPTLNANAISCNTLTAGTNIYGPNGLSLYANGLWNVTLSESGNTYTLKQTTLNGTETTIGSFSRAISSASWSWVGGAPRVTLSPQDQTFFGPAINGITFTGSKTWATDKKSFTQDFYCYDANSNNVYTENLSINTSDSYNAGNSAGYLAGWNAACGAIRKSGNIIIGPVYGSPGSTERKYMVTLNQAEYTASSYTKESHSYSASSLSTWTGSITYGIAASSYYKASSHSYTPSSYTASSFSPATLTWS